MPEAIQELYIYQFINLITTICGCCHQCSCFIAKKIEAQRICPTWPSYWTVVLRFAILLYGSRVIQVPVSKYKFNLSSCATRVVIQNLWTLSKWEIIFTWTQSRWGAGLVALWQRIHLLMQEMQVWSLCQEDPLEKERTTHSSILARDAPWTEEPSRLQSMGSQRVGHNLVSKKQQKQEEVRAMWRGKGN